MELDKLRETSDMIEKHQIHSGIKRVPSTSDQNYIRVWSENIVHYRKKQRMPEIICDERSGNAMY